MAGERYTTSGIWLRPEEEFQRQQSKQRLANLEARISKIVITTVNECLLRNFCFVKVRFL